MIMPKYKVIAELALGGKVSTKIFQDKASAEKWVMDNVVWLDTYEITEA